MSQPLFKKNVRNDGSASLQSTQIIYNLPGGQPPQTTLYNEAGSDPNFVYVGSRLASDANRRYQLAVNGTQLWGDGTAAADVQLSRQGAKTLIVTSDGITTDTSLLIGAIKSLGNTGTHRAFEVAQPSDTSRRVFITSVGKIGLGAGTTTAVQVLGNGGTSLTTNLLRPAEIFALMCCAGILVLLHLKLQLALAI